MRGEGRKKERVKGEKAEAPSLTHTDHMDVIIYTSACF